MMNPYQYNVQPMYGGYPTTLPPNPSAPYPPNNNMPEAKYVATPIVMQQPSPAISNANTCSVVVNAGGGGGGDGSGGNTDSSKERPWSTGIFAIFSDCKICMCVTCCYYCSMCDIATRMDESCFVGCCNIDAGGCSFPVGALALRVKLRTKYNIKGSILQDMCCLYWCHSCAVCQMMREMEKLKIGRV
ncbi:placenta-specific gene 8 protein-like [Tubulanus polymorphus]|uniref:placenta-specific gene 8 protein-like n=1 Tax=Tubulanus polymorphus TaxID=672921 RepID=UPI003DA48D16